MSLDNPENDFEQYVLELRLHMEKMFGQSIKSVCMADVKFRHPSVNKVYKIDIIRFQNHFQIPLPIESLPYLDLFIDPVEGMPRISIFGKNNFSTLLDEPVEPQQLEHLFASLIWGSEMTKKGLQVPVQIPVIQ